MSLHLLTARREAVTQHDRYMARITILESLVERLQRKEHVEKSEIDRLLILSRRAFYESSPKESATNDSLISWKEVFFGRSR